MPTINNQIYNQPENTWWDENNHLFLLKAMVNPWRVPYFSRVLTDNFPGSLDGIQLLDIGCGGGYLTEEFARLGLQTTGIDLSAASIEEAKAHAREGGLNIRYEVGSATALEFQDHSFDAISCCDVLEHIEDWPAAIDEIARVLKPGGLFLFDTINRTMMSYITMIFGLQIFPLTKLFAANTHLWRMFIKPGELSREMEKNGLKIQQLSGGSIPTHPVKIITSVRRYKTGRWNALDLGGSLALQHSPDLSQNYLGYGKKLG